MTAPANPRVRPYRPRGPNPSTGPTPERDRELIELWHRGWHTAAIAAVLGITTSAVVQRRETLGLEPRGGRKSARMVPRQPEGTP